MKSPEHRLGFSGLIAACVVVALLTFGVSGLRAQHANQVIVSPTGNELVQVIPQSSAAIAYMSTSSLRNGRGYIYQAPLTGFTIVMNVNQSAVSLNPAGTLAAGTITLPPALVDGTLVSVFSSQTITALTLNTSNSATFVPAVVATLAAGATVAYVYDKANNQWHRVL